MYKPFKDKLHELEITIKNLSNSANHPPCCSGGIDEEGVYPNTCICTWPKMFTDALTQLKKETNPQW